MKIKQKNIDLESIDLDQLDVEDKILVLRLKGEIGKGDYTKERHKWLDKLSKEEINAELLRISKQQKDT